MKRLIPLALFATLTACTQREIVPFNVKAAHPERFVCEGLADRPAIPPEYLIEWSVLLERAIDGNWTPTQTIDAARNEHLAYVRSIRTREGKVAGYLVEIEGRHFTCASNLQWQRDYYDGLADHP